MHLGLVEFLKIEKDLLNYDHGRFISQLIRAGKTTNQERIYRLAKACAGVARSSEHLRPKNLTALANSYGTDKGTTVGNSHAYTRYYSFLFEQFRYDRFNALEIGLLRGGPEAGGTAGRETLGVPSIAMWLEYFPFARIFGVDISDFKQFQTERFRFHQLDLTNLDDALALRRKIPKMKLVVEDASHASFHQQVAFAAFFPLVESGGYYVIEDCDWQPGHFETELPEAKLTRELFWEFMHFGLHEFPPEITERVDMRGCFDQISDVFVHRKEAEGPLADVIKLFAIRKK